MLMVDAAFRGEAVLQVWRPHIPPKGWFQAEQLRQRDHDRVVAEGRRRETATEASL
jgi:hypothetical protein